MIDIQIVKQNIVFPFLPDSKQNWVKLNEIFKMSVVKSFKINDIDTSINLASSTEDGLMSSNSYNQIDYIEQDLEKFKDDSGLSDYEEVADYEESIGYFFRYTNGVLSAIENYNARLYTVEYGTKYYVTTYLKGQATAEAVFFDSEKNYLGYVNQCVGSNVPYSYDKDYIELPSGTAYVGLTAHMDNMPYLYIKTIINVVDMIETLDRSLSATSVLSGKYIAFVGDSITQASAMDTITDINYIPIYGSNKKSFGYYIASRNNSKWYNYGISGSTLGDCYAIGLDRNGFAKENGRYTQMADTIDYLVIMFGTNDNTYGRYMKAEEYIESKYGAYHMFPDKGYSIGDTSVMTQEEYDDVLSYSGEVNGTTYTGLNYFMASYIGTIDDTDNTTWYGSWNVVLSYILQKYPKIKILIWLNPTGTKFDESTIAIANKYGIPYIDMNSSNTPTIWRKDSQDGVYIGEAELNSYLSGRNITKKDIYTYDGTHPNADGYEYISTIIEDALKRI